MRLRRALVAALLAGCTSSAQPPSDATADTPSTDASYDAPATDRSDANDRLTPRFEAWETGAPSPRCNSSGWCWEAPSPAGGEIVSISSSEPDDGWALTADGMLLHAWGGRLDAMRVHPFDLTLGRGRVWSGGASEVWVSIGGSLVRWDGHAFTRARFYEGFNEPDLVWGSSPRDIWVGGPQGDIVHFDGSGWSRRALTVGVNLEELTGLGQEPWSLDGEGLVSRWRDGRWREVGVLPSSARGLWVSGPEDAWACDDGAVFHWNGAMWRREVVDRVPTSQRCVVWSDGENTWFSDGLGVRRRGADGAWSVESDTLLVTAAGGAPGDVWAGRSDGVIQRLMAGSWVGVTRTRPRFDVTRIAGDDAATLRAITVATVMGFDGVAWFEAIAPTRYYELHGVWPQGATDTWLAGLVRTGARDSGRASRWNRVDGERDVLDAPTPLRAITARASDDVWAVGDGGAAWRFDGAAWARVETGVTADLRDVWSLSRDDAWAVGSNAALHWDGAAWRRVALPSVIDVTRVNGRGARDVWMVGRSESPARAWALHWDGVAIRVDTAGLPAGYDARGVWAGADAVWLAGSSVLRRDDRVWNAESIGVDASMRAVWGTRDGAVRVGGSTTTVMVRSAR